MTETAQRELREETGIAASPRAIGHLRHETATCEGYDERLHVLQVFFHAVYEEGSVTVRPGEMNGAAWFADPPADSRLFPSTQRLLDG